MSKVNSLPSERFAVAAVVAPGALTTGAKSSGVIDASKYGRLCAIISTGTLGASATLDGKWQECDDSSGTNPVDIANGSITQVVKASGDNKQIVHNLHTDMITEGKRYVKYVATVGTATSDAAVIILGVDPRHQPATDLDPASVVQVKST